MTAREDALRHGLHLTVEETHFDAPFPSFPAGLGQKTRGKVRDSYTRGPLRFLVVTDRLSAFDQVLCTLPSKGQVLNQLAAWWFHKTAPLAPNHLKGVIDPAISIAENCTPLPVEFVVRAYLTGVTDTSIWTHYARGARSFCGHTLPEGLRRHEPLPEPILTPSTKATAGHDESVSRADLLQAGTISEEDFDAASAIVHALFRAGQDHCREQDLILVDTKYEIGRTPAGALVVIDEMHTPDSSRFWFRSSYEARLAAGKEPESFDKEYVRRWLREAGYQGSGPPPALPDAIRVEASRRYIEACEAITGAPFTLAADPPLARMAARLQQWQEKQLGQRQQPQEER